MKSIFSPIDFGKGIAFIVPNLHYSFVFEP